MSKLIEHAERELAIIGYPDKPESSTWDPDIAMRRGLLELVTVFARQNHSGSSAAYQAHVLGKLIMFENLAPLTDDPAEWCEVSGGMHQNIRNSMNFSMDGGRTYWTLDEHKAFHGLYKKLPVKARVWIMANKRHWVQPIHTSKISGKATS